MVRPRNKKHTRPCPTKSIDLALEQRRLDNKSGEAFMAVGWENIVKAFNESTGLNTRFYSLRLLWPT